VIQGVCMTLDIIKISFVGLSRLPLSTIFLFLWCPIWSYSRETRQDLSPFLDISKKSRRVWHNQTCTGMEHHKITV